MAYVRDFGDFGRMASLTTVVKRVFAPAPVINPSLAAEVARRAQIEAEVAAAARATARPPGSSATMATIPSKPTAPPATSTPTPSRMDPAGTGAGFANDGKYYNTTPEIAAANDRFAAMQADLRANAERIAAERRAAGTSNPSRPDLWGPGSPGWDTQSAQIPSTPSQPSVTVSVSPSSTPATSTPGIAPSTPADFPPADNVSPTAPAKAGLFGPAAGAAGGFFVGGPIGAALGAAAGYFLTRSK